MLKIAKWFASLTIEAPVQPVAMSAEERSVIVEFARGQDHLRSQAIAIHRAHIPALGARGDIYQRFMAEVDHPVPDYAQRNAFRHAVLEAAAA